MGIDGLKGAGQVGGGHEIYRCGTLTYTKVALTAVFAALLWGDFCYVLMDSMVPSILPLKLKALGCSNTLIGIIMTTAPSLLGIGMVPYISVKSDRYRSRWGRRIPFIAWTLPFLCSSLVLLAYSEKLSLTSRLRSHHCGDRCDRPLLHDVSVFQYVCRFGILLSL